jgi:magnesium transporter
MLAAYGTTNGSLIELPVGVQPCVPEGSVWLDLVEPTHAEESAVEESLGIDIPTREELAEIEASSRLYQEDGAAFMTANLIRRGEDDQPESSPVTFIIKDKLLITVRYHYPQAFPIFIRRAMKAHVGPINGPSLLISLLEAVVDRAADHLERVGQIVDDTSKRVFHSPAQRKRNRNFEELLQRIGEEGDFTSKMRESLVSIGRLSAFMTAIMDQAKQARDMRDTRGRLKTLQRDIISLTDHASFLSAKISFLLDAVLGMIQIEQNDIIKIFSVAAVGFLPPTLVASIYGMNFDIMPELRWFFGYPFAIFLMILSGLIPLVYFRRKGWL